MANVYQILDCAAAADSIGSCAACNVRRSPPVRGAGWFLKWSAATLVLGIAGVTLLGFSYQLAAEQALARAAAVGVDAAALPRATNQTVEHTIRRELINGSQLSHDAEIFIDRVGKPRKGVIAAEANARGRISITLAAPVSAVLPLWLQPLVWRSQHAWIRTHVE